MKREKGKRIGQAVIVLAGLLILVCVSQWNLIRMIFWSVCSPEIELDESEEWKGGTSYEHLQYADVSKSDYLHLYVPDGEEKMPLFVLIHGGGFVMNDCESRQAQFMYRYFRDHGYACATVNYRLAEEAAYPAAIEDVKAAIRFLKAHADAYGYDADKVAVWGESAGGYLAVMAAVTDDDEYADVSFIGEQDLAEPVSARVQALVDFYGCIDFGTIDAQFAEMGVPKIVRTISNAWLDEALEGTGYESCEEYWLREKMSDMTEEDFAEVNPETYAKKNLNLNSDLHVLICHGDADLTVPYLQSAHLADVLADAMETSVYTPDDGKMLSDDAQIQFQLLPDLKHAADGFYTNERLGEVQVFLDRLFQ